MPPGVDLEHPSVARVYDYYLGGTANWAIDREFGKKVLSRFPLLRPIAKANRLFLHRAVRYLVRQGVRQFIDIGSGVPTMGPTHEVADELAPDSRVVYIDNEPVAVAHSEMLLEQHGDPKRHAAINADLRYPDELWRRVRNTGVIDFDQPVALLLIAVLHVHQTGTHGEDLGASSLARLRELLCPGSYLAVSHITTEGVPDAQVANLADLKRMYDTSSSSNAIWRDHTEIRELFGDFEIVEPGLTWTPVWHPEETSSIAPVISFNSPNESVILAGVGRKP
ncbi:MAG TPA: SAM-dependent methyltransferase [Pseudonocardiaceae bacterium]|nr:SAM-dependent methyltransferase [Pseudonocardiaceae bacterium]